MCNEQMSRRHALAVLPRQPTRSAGARALLHHRAGYEAKAPRVVNQRAPRKEALATLTLSDNMSLTVESAASSTIGPCTGLVPMNGTSMACYLDRWKHRQHQSALDGRPPQKWRRTASCASSARPALKRSVMTWPEAAAMS